MVSDDFVEYCYSKEHISLIITYLLGKESPCYKNYLDNNGNWDLARSNVPHPNPLVEMVYYLFQHSTLYDEKFPNSNIQTVKYC